MEPDQVYDMVYEAVTQALADRDGGAEVRLNRRMLAGHVVFRDDEGRIVKEIDGFTFLKKVTAIRDRLRVLEQKINANDAIAPVDRAELQGYLTRCYGSLTTFNFLFREEEDKFKGTGD